MLIGVWYRPPCRSEALFIQSLDEELSLYGSGCINSIVIGDMNVHEKDWLKYSSSSSPEGRLLRTICGKHSLVECVRAPTRGPNLLDLFLTDSPLTTTVKVHAGVSDHSMVYARMNFDVAGTRIQPRECFIYKDARWKAMNAALAQVDWESILGDENPDNVAQNFVQYVLKVAKEYIPHKIVQLKS